MPLKDPEARRAYHRDYMKRYLVGPEKKRKHLARVKKNNKKAKREVDQIIAEWKSDGCAVCGEDAKCCLVAHHLDPSEKDFAIGHSRDKKWPKTIEAELEKCACLCMNCHAKIHADLIELDAG